MATRENQKKQNSSPPQSAWDGLNENINIDEREQNISENRAELIALQTFIDPVKLKNHTGSPGSIQITITHPKKYQS